MTITSTDDDAICAIDFFLGISKYGEGQQSVNKFWPSNAKTSKYVGRYFCNANHDHHLDFDDLDRGAADEKEINEDEVCGNITHDKLHLATLHITHYTWHMTWHLADLNKGGAAAPVPQPTV